MDFDLIWFDSMGAKSSCVMVKTDHNILLEPGVAEMQPSFPASDSQKKSWYDQAYNEIKSAAKLAHAVVISHYHYDHFIDFDPQIYSNKLVVAKDPNQYINYSQRDRAEHFFGNVFSHFGGTSLEENLGEPEEKKYKDPMEELEIASSKDFGDYQQRRNELLDRGRKQFFDHAKKWQEYKKVPEIDFDNVQLKFGDSQKMRLGKTTLRFTEPLFHGIEFSRVGWVFSTVVEYKGEKLIHSSDLNGPVVEDYAQWIIDENPQVLILDGPMTYMLGFTVNKTNFRRTVENAVRIVKETDTEIMIYDHHLTREPKFRERTQDVWETARKLGKNIYTAAEFQGKEPVVLSVADNN